MEFKGIWKDIKGYAGIYKVSNDGRIKSLDRTVIGSNKMKRFIKGTTLKQDTSKTGYKRVELFKNGVGKHYFVHRLVAMAFIKSAGKKRDNLVVDHIDKDRKNNHHTNLRFITARKNSGNPTKKTQLPVGVSYFRYKFKASMTIGSVSVHLGLFLNEDDAEKTYKAALQNLHLYDGNKTKFRTLIKNIISN